MRDGNLSPKAVSVRAERGIMVGVGAKVGLITPEAEAFEVLW